MGILGTGKQSEEVIVEFVEVCLQQGIDDFGVAAAVAGCLHEVVDEILIGVSVHCLPPVSGFGGSIAWGVGDWQAERCKKPGWQKTRFLERCKKPGWQKTRFLERQKTRFLAGDGGFFVVGAIRELFHTTRELFHTTRELFHTTRESFHTTGRANTTRESFYTTIPLGNRSLPLGNRSIPLGNRSIPLGNRSIPLGNRSIREMLKKPGFGKKPGFWRAMEVFVGGDFYSMKLHWQAETFKKPGFLKKPGFCWGMEVFLLLLGAMLTTQLLINNPSATSASTSAAN